jgi:hypothetical protein
MVRRALYGAVETAARSDRLTGGWNRHGVFNALFSVGGLFLHDRKRGLTDVKATLGGTDQIDAWEDHFGLPRSSGSDQGA